MQLSTVTLNCPKNYPASNRRKPFRYVVYRFNYAQSPQHHELIERWFGKAERLAERVNPKAANRATERRAAETIIENCLAGVISEACWRHYLNDGTSVRRVAGTPYVDGGNQIDMVIPRTEQTIEVRSSFPRNPIPFALCHPAYEFDVLGPYANGYKPGEVLKHYYVRTLFHLPVNREDNSPKKLTKRVKEPNFEVFLTGGATWDMMLDEAVSKRKTLAPPDRLDASSVKTEYRVVPFSRALDTVEMYELIKALHEITV